MEIKPNGHQKYFFDIFIQFTKYPYIKDCMVICFLIIKMRQKTK